MKVIIDSNMRFPLTKYGWPQVVIFPAIIMAAMAVCLPAAGILPSKAAFPVEAVLAVILIWCLSFFRDPYRMPPADKDVLLAPADGKVTDIETVEEKSFIGGSAIRIGIFLSIFDVHINRAPCDVKVEKIIYKKGGFKDARNPQAGSFNESNDLFLTRKDKPFDKLIVRQISGAIARRIVCVAKGEQELAGGEDFGMIKFGSRTELYLPVCKDVKILVKIGDKVKAGLSPLLRYEECPE